jgi:hypothetical protein
VSARVASVASRFPVKRHRVRVQRPRRDWITKPSRIEEMKPPLALVWHSLARQTAENRLNPKKAASPQVSPLKNFLTENPQHILRRVHPHVPRASSPLQSTPDRLHSPGAERLPYPPRSNAKQPGGVSH